MPAPDLTDLLLSMISDPSPPQLMLEFRSGVPLTTLINGWYRVHMMAFRPEPGLPLVPQLTTEFSVASIPVGPQPIGGISVISALQVAGVGTADHLCRGHHGGGDPVRRPNRRTGKGEFAEQTQNVS